MASLRLPATVIGGAITSPPSTSNRLRCYLTIPNSVRQHHRSSCFSTVRVLPRRSSSHVVSMAPDEERMTRRSPLDFPIEWERPKPGRRPDIFPQFSPMKTPLPTPMPADPPEEDEDEDEKKEEEEEDPEKEEQDNPEKQ